MTPLFANALQFAFEQATTEGKLTVAVLLVVSLFSWSVIVTKIRQFTTATRMNRRFFAAIHDFADPLDLLRRGQRFEGAPAYGLYLAGATELQRQREADPEARTIRDTAFDAVRIAIEEAAFAEARALEKGMTVLSTAVAGGPFIGLLGTVWGVMETFAGVAKSNAASLTAMAPGVAGALIATVIGLLVAIPAMFAYNFMVTRIRAYTQELDGFALRFATQIEHTAVAGTAVATEVAQAVERALREHRQGPHEGGNRPPETER